MIDGLRAEFPSFGRIGAWRRPGVAREPTPWAFVCAIGAGFIVGGIATLVMLVVYPVLFPSAAPHPDWLAPSRITRAAGGVAIGAVAVRTGGLRALAVYVVYELLQTAAALPGVSLSCSRTGLDPSRLGPCDLPGLIVSRWPTWIALATGAAVSPWLIAAGPVGANRMLRAAGVFGLVLTTANTAAGVLTVATLDLHKTWIDYFTFTSAYVVAELIAGVVAGLILGRSRSAATVLVVLLVVSGLAASLPNIRANWIPNMPLEMMFLSYSGVFAPLVGAIGIVLGWTVGRRRAI